MTGVLCDEKVSLKVRKKCYKTVMKPAMMYGFDCWAIIKKKEIKMKVVEIIMLRWMCGVTKMDRIRNKCIRENVCVT